jgi:hypothetical protein
MVLLAFCVVPPAAAAPSGRPPTLAPVRPSKGCPPRLRGRSTTWPVSTTVTTTIRAPLDQVFRFLVAEDVLPKLLHRHGPIPAVIGTRLIDGPWERVGAARQVLLAGGGTLHEQITELRPPTAFAYRIDDLHTPLGALAAGGRGRWSFAQDGADTRLSWTYEFDGRSRWTRPFLALLVHTFYRGYMKQALTRTRSLLETPGHP